MPTAHINLLLRSKILVGIVMAMLFLLGVLQVAQGFINTEHYRAKIEWLVQERTGIKLNIRGKVRVSLLPVPTLYLPGVELREAGSDTPAPSLTVEMVSIRASFESLFSGDPQAAGIVLERPVLEIERAQGDNRVHWGWLSGAVLPAMGQSPDTAFSMKIIEGRVIYHNARTDRYVNIQNIYAHGASGGLPKAEGSFSLYGHALRFSVRAASEETADGMMPVHVQIVSGKKNTLRLEGAVNPKAETLEIKGKLSLDLENILAWTQSKTEKEEKLIDQITNDFVQQDTQEALFPVSLSGEWEQAGTAVRLSNIQFNGLGSAGAGSVEAKWPDVPHIGADLHFSALNYDQWKLLFDALRPDMRSSAGYPAGVDEAKNPLPADIAATFKMKADQVYVGEQVWKDTRLSATLDHAAVTINQFNVALPGEAAVSLFGIISQGGTGSLRFEGNMEAQGKSLRQMLTVLDPSAAELPETGFGEFAVRANVYVASDQVRLSEADAKISDLHLNGGLVAYYDVNPRVEADVRLKNINFDYFRDAWREKQKAGGAEDFFLQYDKGMRFNWLRKLRASIDFKTLVDGFTFMERDGSSASFRLYAKDGELGIYNVRLYYPGDVLEGSLSLDVKSEQPFFNVLLNSSELDTSYFSPNPDTETNAANVSVSQQRWPEGLIDMGWMEDMGGAIDLSIGTLKHRGKVFGSVKLQARLENSVLNLRSLTFNYWQGRCSMNGSLYGGKVPGIAVGFTLYSAELQDILQSLVGRDNITGKVSISGTLTTSGVNYLSWVSQSTADLILTGRGVNVSGFNLQGVADAVAVSRTSSDVVNNVNLALLKGSTEMSIDGNINVRGGVVRTPGIALRSGSMIGNMAGEVHLVPWTMRLSSLYQFPAMTSETVPTMTIQIAGALDRPEMQVDTSSLEAYVAKRLIGSSVGN